MRSAIGSVNHAPTEMFLTRQCADVSKLVYHMRINGDMLDKDLLDAFDGQLRASVSVSLNGDLPDHSWWQATTSVTCDGLGLRTALGIALPRLHRQPHYVSPLGIHHGRPHQPRLRRPESAHHGRVRLAHQRRPHAPRLDASGQRGSASSATA